EMLGVAEVDQRIEAGDRLEDDGAALAPVTAVGPGGLDELRAPGADGARAAGAGLHVDLGLVEEVHRERGLGDVGDKWNLSGFRGAPGAAGRAWRVRAQRGRGFAGEAVETVDRHSIHEARDRCSGRPATPAAGEASGG